MNPDRLEMLMVKVVDEVATPSERQELMTLTQGDPALRHELEAHLALKATTDQLITRLDHDRILDAHHAKPTVGVEVALGWTLFFAGLALVVGYLVYQFLFTPDIALPLRLGVAGIAAGGMVLLASAVRTRLTLGEHDRYREIIR